MSIQNFQRKKHAYLIMAHRDETTLRHLIDLLDDERNDIYLHVNLKSKNFPSTPIICAKARLIQIPSILVKWAGESQVLVILKLLRCALTNGKYDYYHFMTGQDLPIKTQDEINEFFDNNPGYEFIDLEPKSYRKSVMTKYYSMYDNPIGEEYGDLVNNYAVHLQKSNGVNRNQLNQSAYYFGTLMFSISYGAAKYLVRNELIIIQDFLKGYNVDQVFLPTLLFNSVFKENIKPGLYFTSMDGAHGKIQRRVDLNSMINSSKLFTRKIDSEEDYDCLLMLYSHLKNATYEPLRKMTDLYEYKTLSDLLKVIDFSQYILILSNCGPVVDAAKKVLTETLNLKLKKEFIVVIENKKIIESIDQIELNGIVVHHDNYHNENQMGRVFITLHNKCYSMVDNDGLNVYVLKDLQIVDAICCGGSVHKGLTIRRPQLMEYINSDCIKYTEDVELLNAKDDSYESPFLKVRYLSLLRNRYGNTDLIINELKNLSDNDNPFAQLELSEAIELEDKGRSNELLTKCAEVLPLAVHALFRKYRHNEEMSKIFIPLLQKNALRGDVQSAGYLCEYYAGLIKPDYQSASYWARLALDYVPDYLYANKVAETLSEILFLDNTTLAKQEVYKIGSTLYSQGRLVLTSECRNFLENDSSIREHILFLYAPMLIERLIVVPETRDRGEGLARHLDDLGIVEACGIVGKLYAKKQSVDFLNRSLDWLRISSNHGVNWASIELIETLYKLNNINNSKEVVALIQRLECAKDKKTIEYLAGLYFEGHIVNQDLEYGRKILSKSNNEVNNSYMF